MPAIQSWPCCRCNDQPRLSAKRISRLSLTRIWRFASRFGNKTVLCFVADVSNERVSNKKNEVGVRAVLFGNGGYFPREFLFGLDVHQDFFDLRHVLQHGTLYGVGNEVSFTNRQTAAHNHM